jgi:UDP-3-O-[3-hydroxymyristoyl] glucosamine N-acyltransferase
MEGKYCIIDKRVDIGQGTVIMNYVEIRRNTLIGHNCYIDSRVNISGGVEVGNYVTLRYGVILDKGCTVGDRTYIAPRVMTHNLNSEKKDVGGARIGENCFIGAHSVLNHGISICDNVTISPGTLVLRDVTEPGTYVNSYEDGSLKLIKIDPKPKTKTHICYNETQNFVKCAEGCERCKMHYKLTAAYLKDVENLIK